MTYSAVMMTHSLKESWLTAHVLQSYLQNRPDFNYCLRERSHNKTLITKTADLSERDFFIRMIYKGTY